VDDAGFRVVLDFNSLPGAQSTPEDPPSPWVPPCASARNPALAKTAKRLQEWLKQGGFDPGPVDGVVGQQTVATLQAFLRTEGYYAYEPDGYLGPATNAAVQKWQAAMGVPQTGEIDEATISAVSQD
jgi:peptidoglycan hydrolase-like protein with peptidoglycan-binding domain